MASSRETGGIDFSSAFPIEDEPDDDESPVPAVPVAVNREIYSVALDGPMHRMDGAVKRHAKLLTELRAALEREA